MSRLIPINDGASHFHTEPADLAGEIHFNVLPRIEEGLPALVERVLPWLESEAIARLRHAGLNPIIPDEAWLKRNNPAAWRHRWAWCARNYLNMPPEMPLETMADGPLNAPNGPLGKTTAAAEILTRAADLRRAIEAGEAEKAAALGMLLASWVFIGGVSIRLDDAEPVAMKFRQGQRERAAKERHTVQADGGGVRKRDLVQQAMRAACLGARTPEVWGHLVGVLEQNGMHATEVGAKEGRTLHAVDMNGTPLRFSFKGVQTMLRDLRQGRGKPVKRGRPTTKPA